MSDVKSAVPGSREEQIKTVAYRLWLEEGCPEGRAETHWFQAVEFVEAVPTATPEAKAKARPKAVTAKAAGRAGKAKSS
jgi:hypothetical protein